MLSYVDTATIVADESTKTMHVKHSLAFLKWRTAKSAGGTLSFFSARELKKALHIFAQWIKESDEHNSVTAEHFPRTWNHLWLLR